MAVNVNTLLFEVELAKIKKSFDDWNIFTTDEERDRDLRKFQDLMGSATLYLKSRPEAQKHVVAKINDYTNGFQNWVSLGRSDLKIAERMNRGIAEIKTILNLPDSQVAVADPLPPQKDAATAAALAKVTGQVDELKKEIAADKARKAEEALSVKKERPWWLLPVVGAGAAYTVPKLIRIFGI